MIVTLTPNTAIDHVLFVSDLVLNRVNRAEMSVESMGGKPTDASWILGELGIHSLALGFSAGATGQLVERLLCDKGVETDFVAVEGDSRRNIVIIDRATGTQTTVTSASLGVTEAHVEALRSRYIRALDSASCVITGGSLPAPLQPDFYTEFIRLAVERKVPVIFDSGEPHLSVGLAAGPTFIKPNRHELSQLMGETIDTIDAAYLAGLELRQRYGVNPIITLDREGGLAMLPEGTYRIPPLKVDVVNAAGAGDGVLAGLASALQRGQSLIEGLRLGFAAAAAVVTMPGTAECRRADVERFIPQIEIIPYQPSNSPIH